MKMRILLISGGTGGHVFPALAVAEELKQRAVDIFWMGTEKGIESKLVPAAHFPISYINVEGLRGNGILGWLFAPFKVVRAIIESLKILNIIKPDVVLTLGGFASGPGGIAVKLAAIPLAIHEQNAIPGLTNKLLSPISQKVMEAFSHSFPRKIDADWVGNPIRWSIENAVDPKQRFKNRNDPLRLLVIGGSLGAKSLNTLIPQALALLDRTQCPQIKHQCGHKHIEDCQQSYSEMKIHAEITEFIDDMACAYAWSDLVVCRAGALTISELAATGVAAILVPYPYAVDDHQTHNASVLVNVGAAKLITEKRLTVELLAAEIINLSYDRDYLLTMAQAARSQAKLGTAKYMSNVCMELAHA